jgi:Na+/melibiose symporter-like transporter
VFMPLRPTPRWRMIVRAIAGPLLWLIALVIVLITLDRTQAIELGVLIAAASFAVSMIVLLVLRAIRLRQERRDVPR